MKISAYILFSIFLLVLLVVVPSISAKVSVNISNNVGGNSSSKVEVNSSSQVVAESINNSSIKTRIRIESNGEVKEYNSDTPENVSIQSTDGSAKVNVNNSYSGSSSTEGDDTLPATPTPTTTDTPTATPTPTKTQDNEALKDNDQKNNNFQLEDELVKLIALLFFRFPNTDFLLSSLIFSIQ